jgi:hypothetical protein
MHEKTPIYKQKRGFRNTTALMGSRYAKSNNYEKVILL